MIASIAATVSIIFLLRQLSLAREALCEQKSATEAEVYKSLNIEFLNILRDFPENINKITNLSEVENKYERTLARYFYLAHTEYTLIQQGIIKADGFKNHWLTAIKASSRRKPFVEYWEKTAAAFSFSENFRKFYNDAISESGRTSSN